jgi:uncharacterized OB-fold protein
LVINLELIKSTSDIAISMSQCKKCNQSFIGENSICDMCELKESVSQMRNEILDLRGELLAAKEENLKMKKEFIQQFNNLLSKQIDYGVVNGLIQDDILNRIVQQEIRVLIFIVIIWYILNTN